MDNIKGMFDTLGEFEQETKVIMLRLPDIYKIKKIVKPATYKLSQEIKQLEIEYSSAESGLTNGA